MQEENVVLCTKPQKGFFFSIFFPLLPCVVTQEMISVLFLHKMLGQWTGFSSTEKDTVAALDLGPVFASPRREI